MLREIVEDMSESFTGEPYISYTQMGNAYTKMYSRWAEDYKKVNKKLKGIGEFSIDKVNGTTSSVPSMVLWYSKNKKNKIILTQDARYSDIELSLHVGNGHSIKRFKSNSLDVSDIKQSLKELNLYLGSMDDRFKSFAPFDFPKAFKDAVK